MGPNVMSRACLSSGVDRGGYRVKRSTPPSPRASPRYHPTGYYSILWILPLSEHGVDGSGALQQSQRHEASSRRGVVQVRATQQARNGRLSTRWAGGCIRLAPGITDTLLAVCVEMLWLVVDTIPDMRLGRVGNKPPLRGMWVIWKCNHKEKTWGKSRPCASVRS